MRAKISTSIDQRPRGEQAGGERDHHPSSSIDLRPYRSPSAPSQSTDATARASSRPRPVQLVCEASKSSRCRAAHVGDGERQVRDRRDDDQREQHQPLPLGCRRCLPRLPSPPCPLPTPIRSGQTLWPGSDAPRSLPSGVRRTSCVRPRRDRRRRCSQASGAVRVESRHELVQNRQ